MAGLHNLEWLNLNSERNYPIKENASRKDIHNTIELPNQLILDAVFSVNDPSISFYINQVYFYDENIIIKIHDSDNVFVGSVNIETGIHTIYDYYPIVGHGIYKYIQGKMVIGDLNLVNSSILGSFTFDSAATKFEDTVLIPSLKGVNSIQVNNADYVLTGDINLTAGYNVRLRVDQNLNVIYIDAIEGEGLGEECICGEAEEKGDPLRTINGIRGDDYGNFNIRGLGCIEVGSAEGGITIKNVCEEICCDCDDVEELRALLKNKQTQIDNLDERVRALEAV